MAIRYTVKHYSFREPKAISEYEYLRLKQKLQTDQNFSLIDPNDTITNNYSLLFKFLIGALISFPISLILTIAKDLTKNNGFFVIVMIITGLWSVIGLIAFLMIATELSTYAGYLKKKRAYFGKMEAHINKSNNYDDFFNNFYK